MYSESAEVLQFPPSDLLDETQALTLTFAWSLQHTGSFPTQLMLHDVF